MSRPIDADKLSADMYHEAFEKDSDMQKWDSGCWIRYKMFENVLKAQPTVEVPDTNVGNMDAISRQAVKDIFTELYGISAIGSVFDKHEWKDICETTANELPSVQPDDDRLERCRFEYVNACKILAHRTPDTRKKDINDAYAVVRALNPIFGEESF
jgi:hypothetical protein